MAQLEATEPRDSVAASLTGNWLRDVSQDMDQCTDGTIAGIANPPKSMRGGVAPVVIGVLKRTHEWSHGAWIAKTFQSECCLP